VLRRFVPGTPGDVARRRPPRLRVPARHRLDGPLEALTRRQPEHHHTVNCHEASLARAPRAAPDDDPFGRGSPCRRPGLAQVELSRTRSQGCCATWVPAEPGFPVGCRRQRLCREPRYRDLRTWLRCGRRAAGQATVAGPGLRQSRDWGTRGYRVCWLLVSRLSLNVEVVGMTKSRLAQAAVLVATLLVLWPAPPARTTWRMSTRRTSPGSG